MGGNLGETRRPVSDRHQHDETVENVTTDVTGKTRGRRGPAPGTPRGPRMPRAERETQLIAIAEDIFATHGYIGATMEDIAQAAGITKPVVYDLFGSKEGLLAACLAKSQAELDELMNAAWHATKPQDGLEAAFRAGVLAFFTFMDQHARLWTVIQRESNALGFSNGDIEGFRLTQAEEVTERLLLNPKLAHLSRPAVEGVVAGLVGACERVAVYRTRVPGITAEEATDMIAALTWDGLNAYFG